MSNFTDWIQNKWILKGILMALQNQTDESGNIIAVDSSACLEAFDEFEAVTSTMSLDDIAAAKTAYEQARSAKGSQGATDMGFWINFAGDYQELVISGFEFYNECNVDYYMVAVGSNVQNPSGLANLGTNLAFRVFNGEDTTLSDLATAISTYATSATTRGTSA